MVVLNKPADLNWPKILSSALKTNSLATVVATSDYFSVQNNKTIEYCNNSTAGDIKMANKLR
jgi:hypothetical protein